MTTIHQKRLPTLAFFEGSTCVALIQAVIYQVNNESLHRDESNSLIAAWTLSDHNATWSAITECCPDMIFHWDSTHYYRIYMWLYWGGRGYCSSYGPCPEEALEKFLQLPHVERLLQHFQQHTKVWTQWTSLSHPYQCKGSSTGSWCVPKIY